MKPVLNTPSANIDPLEIAKFQGIATQWWDEAGPMAPLHRMTPCRLEFITAQIRAHFGHVKGLQILDVGCGGGIVSEALARLGAHVTGIDGASDLIAIAQNHAKDNQLKIDYQVALTEELVKAKKQFDVVLALEVIEHVPDQDMFVQEIATLTKQKGLTIFSTLNRTPQSFALGVVAAEYLLQWLPKGTHDWKKFVKPSELHELCMAHHLHPSASTGMMYRLSHQDFVLDTRNLKINYLLSAVKS